MYAHGEGELDRLRKRLDTPGVSPEGRASILAHFDTAPSYSAFYMTAFDELGTERRNTMASAGRIPRSAIKDYGRDFGFEGEDLYDFLWIIQRLDAHYLQVILPRAEQRKSRA